MSDETTPAPTGKEVATRNAQLELIGKAIFGEAELPKTDPEAMSRAIMERILAADTFEEAFTPQAIPAWKDLLLDVPVVVTDVHFNRSTFENSFVYAVCDVAGPDGVVHTVTCGSKNVLAGLVTMLKNGWTDRAVKIISKPTSEGFTVLWLEAA